MSEVKLTAECKLCETSYKTFRKLQRHLKKRHADLEVLPCYYCDYLTHDLVTFIKHKEKFHPCEKFMCKKCDFKTRKWTRMERHFDKHKTNSINEISSLESLKLSSHHTGKENDDSKSNLKETVQTIIEDLRKLEEDKHVCKICNKKFRYKSNLDSHLNVHSQERLYKCSKCDYAGNWKSSLANHMKIHSDERLYKCSFCEYKARTGFNLRSHINIHLNKRDFECEICNNCFFTKYHLQLHIRVHTKEKPYKCHVCEKAFSQSGALKTHLKRVHHCVVSCRRIP